MNHYQKPERIALLLLVYFFVIPSAIGACAAWIWSDKGILLTAALGGLFVCLILNILFALFKGTLIVREYYHIGVVSAKETPAAFFINLFIYLFLAIVIGLILIGSAVKYIH